MAEQQIIPFNPSPAANFQFQATLDGQPYNFVCTFNAYAQRYYVGIYDLNQTLILERPVTASPAGYNIDLAGGYFDTSVIFRDTSQSFEIPGLPQAVPLVAPRPPTPSPPAPPPPSANYAQELSSDNPLIWWRMGDAVGSSTGVDSGSLNLPFTLTGTNDAFGGIALWQAGASLICAGNEYNAGIAPHNPAVNFQGAGFTITSLVVWNGGADNCNIAGHGQTNTDWANWDLFVTPSGHFAMYLSSANTSGARVQFTSATTINVGEVYRLAARWDSSSGEVGLWINDARVATATWAHTPWVASSPIGVGTFPHASGGDTSNGQFQGNISELAIYDYPLSDSRLAAQYNAL